MAHHHNAPTGPVGPAPQPHQVVYTTLHYDTPWSYENYLKTGGYAALRKILEEKKSCRRDTAWYRCHTCLLEKTHHLKQQLTRIKLRNTIFYILEYYSEM